MITFGGVDLSAFIKDASFELSPWQESLLNALPSGSMMLDFTSRWSITFKGTAAEGRKRRLSRMRAAYRARRR